MIKIKLILIFFLFFPSGLFSNELLEKRGLLLWFYSLETKLDKSTGNIILFKQTAGVSYKNNKIHKISGLSKQSKVSLYDDNWYLDINSNKIVVNNKRPIFLGQMLDITLPLTSYIFIKEKNNIELTSLKFNKELQKYIEDRKDLDIYNPEIIKIRDDLKRKNSKVLDYIKAVDKFVNENLKYDKPIRPNTSVDLLHMDKGWCGEFAKLKQSLLRSAGIPTRDVYASKFGVDGPSFDSSAQSKVHVWLQSYIPNIGWINVPSTRKMSKGNQVVSFRGDYYIRAIELYKYPKEKQKKIYSYKALKRIGGIRGNGIFIPLEEDKFEDIKIVINDILDYNKIPNIKIFDKIELLPSNIKPILYWFLISVPDKNIYEKASEHFLSILKNETNWDLNKFYIVSPTIVKERIDTALNNLYMEK